MLEPFMAPLMEETFTTLEVYPGVRALPLARRGRKAILAKNCAVTLVAKVAAQASLVEARKCFEIASAEEESGSPFFAFAKKKN
jgi:hypothetical protein